LQTEIKALKAMNWERELTTLRQHPELMVDELLEKLSPEKVAAFFPALIAELQKHVPQQAALPGGAL
jgi:hypothetical protein